MDKYIHPITFEEAIKNIDDPNYGIGVVKLWQLPDDWPGTKTAKIHDVRYDFLEPGVSTDRIDTECIRGWEYEGCNPVQIKVFSCFMNVWGMIFQQGVFLCQVFDGHDYKPCSYGQKNKVYDMRCSRCGLHRSLTAEEQLKYPREC